MEDLNLAVKHDGDSRTGTLFDIGAKTPKQSFNIAPPDVARDRMREDGQKRLLMSPHLGEHSIIY